VKNALTITVGTIKKLNFPLLIVSSCSSCVNGSGSFLRQKIDLSQKLIKVS